MKNLKKIGLGLAAFFLLAIISLLNNPGIASAAPPSKLSANGITYTATWVDRSHIQVTATTKSGKTTSHILTDPSWDSDWEYTANFQVTGSTCGSMKMNGFDSAIVGMTSRSGRGAWGPNDSYGNLTVDDGTCTNVIDNQQIAISKANNASISFKATSSDTIQIIDQGQSMSFSNPRLQKDGTVRYYQDGVWGDNCQRIITVNFSGKIQNFPVGQMMYADQTSSGVSKSYVDPNCQVTFTQSSPPHHGSNDDATISNYSYVLGAFTTLKKPSNVLDGNGSASDPGANGGSTDTSACVFQTNNSGLDKSLSWILCPVINGLSASADGINKWVSSELNFSVKDNLGPSVHNAWNVFKYLTSGILVIVMLIMVFSQAIGGGPFDAYTVRKMLPRLVAAVILMQVAWYICIWLIQIANASGQGIAGLMAAPFGGTGNLDLASLLHRLSGVWAGIAAVGTGAGLITAIVFGGALLSFGWPILVLALVLVVIAIIVALVTLLFRNAFIILLVIFSPLAILTFVLPGTEKYWKVWRENFIKLLVFFPLVMAMIYGGRIFAWIAGGLGTPGPLDLIMVLGGFFGPYFFLPKSFKWGGTMLSSAYQGVAESWPIKKGREAASKELMQRQQRNINEYAAGLNPERDGYARRAPGRRFGVLPNWEGSLAKTALWNARAGRLIPGKRNLATAIQRGEQFTQEENAIAAAKVKRAKDMAARERPGEKTERPTYTYSLDERGNVKAEVSDNATARSKAAVFNIAGSADERDAGMAVESALKTSSWVEMQKNLVPVEDPALQKRIRDSGAEVFEGDQNNPATKGKLFVRMYDLPRYNTKVNASEELYPMPIGKYLLATPHISNPDGKNYQQLQAEENEAARREGRPARALKPHHIKRALDVIDGYLDAGNITNQSEAEFKEFGRLAKQDPEVAVRFGKLLERIASGGQGGINVLTQLNSSASMQGTIKGILNNAPKGEGEGLVKFDSISGYLDEGKANIAGQATPPAVQTPAPQAQAAAAAPAAAAPASRPSPQQTVFQSGEGQIVVKHEEPRVVQLQPGEAVSPGGVVLAPRAQAELNANFEILRNEMRGLKRLGVRNQQQTQRLEELQNTLPPEWQRDEEDNT